MLSFCYAHVLQINPLLYLFSTFFSDARASVRTGSYAPGFVLFPKQTECYQSCNPPTAYRSTRVLCWVHKSLQQIGYCHNRRNSHWSSRSQRQMTRFQHTLGNHSKSARRTAFQNNYPPEHIFCFCDPQWWKWPVDIPAHGKPRHPGGNSRPRWHRKKPTGHDDGFARYPHSQDQIPPGEL